MAVCIRRTSPLEEERKTQCHFVPEIKHHPENANEFIKGSPLRSGSLRDQSVTPGEHGRFHTRVAQKKLGFHEGTVNLDRGQSLFRLRTRHLRGCFAERFVQSANYIGESPLLKWCSQTTAYDVWGTTQIVYFLYKEAHAEAEATLSLQHQR